jgi:hypothetical protein
VIVGIGWKRRKSKPAKMTSFASDRLSVHCEELDDGDSRHPGGGIEAVRRNGRVKDLPSSVSRTC